VAIRVGGSCGTGDRLDEEQRGGNNRDGFDHGECLVRLERRRL
jgi:hypothetical protein